MRVPGLLAEGRLDRVTRVLARADVLCPASAPANRGALVTVLAELGPSEERGTASRCVERFLAGSPTGNLTLEHETRR